VTEKEEYTKTEDNFGRQVKPIVLNEEPDGSGKWRIPIVDEEGRLITSVKASELLLGKVRIVDSDGDDIVDKENLAARVVFVNEEGESVKGLMLVDSKGNYLAEPDIYALRNHLVSSRGDALADITQKAVRTYEDTWIDRLVAEQRLLTTTGVQYNVADADAGATTVQNTETDMFTVVLDKPNRAGLIDHIDFGLTVALIQITGAVNGTYRWYIDTAGGENWLKIYERGSIALGAAYTEYSCGGRWKQSGLTYPVKLKLTLETDGGTNMGNAKISHSSYARIYLK